MIPQFITNCFRPRVLREGVRLQYGCDYTQGQESCKTLSRFRKAVHVAKVALAFQGRTSFSMLKARSVTHKAAYLTFEKLRQT